MRCWKPSSSILMLCKGYFIFMMMIQQNCEYQPPMPTIAKNISPAELCIGEGLVGQAAIEKDIIHRTEIPEYYLSITSGILGEKKPDSLLIVPLFMEEKLQGAFEFASVKEFKPHEIEFVKGIAEIVARTFYNLKITEKTEMLLHESQEMTQELKENEEELRQNAEEMRLTQEELEKTNTTLEEKIQEVNQSQKRLYSFLKMPQSLLPFMIQRQKAQICKPLGNQYSWIHGR
jgi:hypothetical protein